MPDQKWIGYTTLAHLVVEKMRNSDVYKRQISIYPYRFDQRMITFELYTDVKNSAYASEMGTNVIQAGMIEDLSLIHI